MTKKIVICLCVLLILCGCSNTPKQRLITGGLLTSSNINPDHNGRPSPIIIRIYQLRSQDNFINTDFFSLYDQGETILAKDLINFEERELLPGARYEYKVELDPETLYVGVIAAFRDIDNAKWISVDQVPAKKWFDLVDKPVIDININKLSVEVEFRIP